MIELNELNELKLDGWPNYNDHTHTQTQISNDHYTHTDIGR